MNIHKILITVLLIHTGGELFSQIPLHKDSVVHFREVVINSNRILQFTSSNHTQTIDTTLLKICVTSNITDVLNISSLCNINSYGPGGLSTCSMRGGNSSQTAVVWNGFNVQSPNSGQQNMSLIPSAFVDNISVQYGGNSALYGNSAIGGVVNINSQPEVFEGIKLKTLISGGSFGYKYGSASVNFGYKKLYSSVRIFRDFSINDYKYYSVENKIENQKNSAYEQKGVLISELFHLNGKNQILFNYWYVDYFNENPPTMLNTLSLSKEHKYAQRGTIEWKYNSKKYTLNIKNGVFDDKLFYNDPILKINNNSNTKSIISDIESTWIIKNKQLLSVAVNRTFEEGYSEYYGANKDRTKYAGGINYKLFVKRLSVYSSGRVEFIDKIKSPLTYTLGTNYNFYKNFFLRAAVSKNYRLPTFNDLYWGSWGNPELKAENGITSEIGINASNKIKQNVIESWLTFFNNDVNNLISWTPEGSKWTPKNINKVWSRGFEFSGKYIFKIRKSEVLTGANYSYTVSTNNLKTDENYRKQLIYIPVYKANSYIMITYKTLSFLYGHQYVGNRYYTEDNSKVVSAYDVGNIQVNFKSNFKNGLVLQYFVKINNLWNTDYQVVAWYAMPMRYFQTGVSINFSKMQNTKN